MYLGRNQEALALFENVLEKSSSDEEAWYAKGFSLRKLKRYGEALQAYERAFLINPLMLNVKEEIFELKHILSEQKNTSRKGWFR